MITAGWTVWLQEQRAHFLCPQSGPIQCHITFFEKPIRFAWLKPRCMCFVVLSGACRCCEILPALMDEDGEWFGRVFENAVGAHLCKGLTDVSYWRDGNAEVDFVVVIDKQIIAIEVKSGRRKGSSGLSEFKTRFPNSRTVLMDFELGEKFLLASDARKFLLNLVDDVDHY
ncbi:MAG: DUF4143 domain-containing protein [Deltaproteobacteria bacterium]|nr:DUF4143 domain-containing protein [Deltaproteobacteria bacterium]